MTSRLLWRIHELDPTHRLAPHSLVWRKNQDALADWLTTHAGQQVITDIARAELADVTAASVQIGDLERRLRPLVTAAAPTLLQIHGCGILTAARVIAETADVARFRSQAAFVRYAGLAPVPYSSGSGYGRLRSHKGGNRALNAALHQMVMVRIQSRGPDAEAYRQRVQSRKHASAMRRLKRRLARTVFACLRADHDGLALRNLLAELQLRAHAWSSRLPDAERQHRTRGPRRRNALRANQAYDDPLLRTIAATNNRWLQLLTGTAPDHEQR